MSHIHEKTLVALAGQPNCGKSTIFNMLTGARQHVANFPGVTVEKKQGKYKDGKMKLDVVDLPGTYSLTSYTQEERVARDFLLLERPEVVVTVVDASNLERHLYLVFQLREMRVPMILCLNMMDVAERRGVKIDTESLSRKLGIPVVATVGKTGKGAAELKATIANLAERHEHYAELWKLDYGEILEPVLASISERLEAKEHLMEDFPPRWLAIKLLENDSEARRIVQHHTHESGHEEILQYVDERRRILREEYKTTPEKVIATSRYRKSMQIVDSCSTKPKNPGRSLTDKIDSVVLHRIGAPVILALVLFLFYQIAMIFGTWASDEVFPYINELKAFTQSSLESADPIRPGLFESLMTDGLVGGIVAILYYVPMFFVLFGLLAIMEDSGYMARIAFILDRLLRWFGLHGQSTLPMILGGVVVGGCCVPGVMATRAMKDERAKLVTILIMPLMNCLAKIPFYTLIVSLIIAADAGLYWGENMLFSYRGLALFGLSVFGFCVALLVAKVFSTYLVKGQSAPFVMELPVYHMPTIGGVLRRAIERVWVFVCKIVTVVAVVQVMVWFFVTFPGIGLEREKHYDNQLQEIRQDLLTSAGKTNPYIEKLSKNKIASLISFMDEFKDAKSEAKNSAVAKAEAKLSGKTEDEISTAVNEAKKKAELDILEKYTGKDPVATLIANGGEGLDGKDKSAKKIYKALRNYSRDAASLRRERKKEQITASFAGWLGHSVEPVSKLAGFEWRMNIAIMASFAAKESLVGTLGTIYSVEEKSGQQDLAESVGKTETGWTLWHKLAILIFVAMFPPCLATLIVIKSETASWGWTIFASIYPIVLGFTLAVFVFKTGPMIFPGI